MIAGVPWQTCLLAAFAVLPGLGIALRFYRMNRR